MGKTYRKNSATGEHYRDGGISANFYRKELPSVRRTEARSIRRSAAMALAGHVEWDALVLPEPHRTEGWLSH